MYVFYNRPISHSRRPFASLWHTVKKAGLLRHTSGCIAQAGLEFTVLLPWSQEGWDGRFSTTFDLSKRENLWLLVCKEKRKAEGHHYLQISKTLMTAWSS